MMLKERKEDKRNINQYPKSCFDVNQNKEGVEVIKPKTSAFVHRNNRDMYLNKSNASSSSIGNGL